MASTAGSFKRRDYLIANEKIVRELWSKRKPYEIEARDQKDAEDESFYVTFPFPYMNGRLHLGHAFSLTKSEFTARFQRLQGKRVLWPFAFHCTGMPIAACADKLKHEIADNANGYKLPVPEGQETEEVVLSTQQTYGSKKSKAVAKTGGARSQWEILRSLGVSENEIPQFADANHWLSYFPPLGKSDLEKFGLGVDWRRAFITTAKNPYFDKFVQWQFKLLLERDRLKFGLRPAIFSRIDDQPCADHDRASGEAVNPQAYTLIKLRVERVPDAWLARASCLRGKQIFLTAATLRPETMYGQTNCFVLPGGDYGVFPAFDRQLTMEEIVSGQKGYVAAKTMAVAEMTSQCNVYYVCSIRAASNMAFQGIIPLAPQDANHSFQNPHSVLNLKGTDMIGLAVLPPLSAHKIVYALPLPSIKMDKGTGIVTSVPSDAPDDYAMLRDLRNKEKLRAEFGVKLEWCEKDVVEVLEIPGYGCRAAADLCEKRKVNSWKDEDKLKEIKQELYIKSFYEGIMIIGQHNGKQVKDVKETIKEEMIANNEALNYLEPERKVVSRSGDDCIVALCNQWYSDFGNSEWTKAVMNHVEDETAFEAFGQRSAYVHTVDWLEGWACSRNYGLGTLLPWEAEQGNHVLIESLSDSTVYFAYYTIAHYLQGDLYGATPGLFNIKPDDLTMEVFNYVFYQTDELPLDSNISDQHLKILRQSFLYWYPMNLRCSGKDLVPNHLTMSLFHHAAIWPKHPELWPRGFYVNGHVMLDSEKMSKSTGNFLSLDEACDAFSADGARIALADAGDSVDDANFERQTANTGLMKLYILCQFVEEVLQKKQQGVLRTGPKTLLDKVFENEMVNLCEKAKEAYQGMIMRDALKFSFFEFISLKDTYRNIMESGTEFHEELIFKWIEAFCLVMSPIACFTCEHIWSVLLQKPELVVNERWPTFDAPFNGDMHRQFVLLTDVAESARKQLDKLGGKKGKDSAAQSKPEAAIFFVARSYQPWQQEVLKVLKTIALDPKTHTPLHPKFIDVIKNDEHLKSQIPASQFKEALGFASFHMKEEVRLRGPSALDLEVPFDELSLLKSYTDYLQRSTGIKKIQFRYKEEGHPLDKGNFKSNLATPGKPAVMFLQSESMLG
eukprot:Gregarina_sp_Poly_1__10163@NODE_698_length_6704_cov_82_277535_g526_i0_p1_GENE_NODE_698_length_6704_cov_82_277535_g526_i0NODE_698_length_6704_cov_82_277535_g526_i0_p1_ORF_typecomplete_len1124_score183_98tRNAsynt_1/PF00133_22/8_1e89tRNAsynt_1g/PF09334_11/2_7e11tRNAsynt_1g/PF09334_11/69tRNAsynt_1g/PF09334_11/2_7e17tRNAsynt_1e/PF01406_19/3tRNAsynt_1e/PF01406_19/2e12Anticodon_1/PF08264_13/5_4e10tRNAsynt_1d/PF00750_19/2_2tRNAsynt_1d/PF00750_19/29tRNAsynt_1f/PF01921_18/0_22_NODE_698_length_6704_cov_82_